VQKGIAYNDRVSERRPIIEVAHLLAHKICSSTTIATQCWACWGLCMARRSQLCSVGPLPGRCRRCGAKWGIRD
ncbi:unnamed protein product, partial [Polarella glacialis]